MGILSKEALLKANILPKLQLGIKTEKGIKTTGKHHVKLIEEKLINGKEFGSGTPIPMMRYIFEENGEKYKYDARLKDKDSGELHYLVQSMATVSEGDEIVIEMVKKGMKNVVIVQKIGDIMEAELPEDDDVQAYEEETVNI